MLFLVAIIIGAWYGGWGPGLFGILLSVVVLDYFFIPPLHAFTIVPLRDLAELSSLMLGALVVVAFSVAHRRNDVLLREGKAQLKQAHALAHLGSYEFHIPHSRQDHWSDETFRIVGRDPAEGEMSPDQYIFRVVHLIDRAYVTKVVEQAIGSAKASDSARCAHWYSAHESDFLSGGGESDERLLEAST